MVKVTARQRVYYAGKEYAPGEDFEATERHALQLGAIRKVMRAETAPAAPPEEPPWADNPLPDNPPVESPPKGRLKRRDMRADD